MSGRNPWAGLNIRGNASHSKDPPSGASVALGASTSGLPNLRYFQMSDEIAPAQLHWAALDLPPTSTLPAADEPFTTLITRDPNVSIGRRVVTAARQLKHKLAGKREPAPRLLDLGLVKRTWRQLLGTFLLTFVTMLLISALHYHVFLTEYKTEFFVAPFGATAAIVFGLTDSDSAQPRNVFLGHLLSSFIGITARHAFAARGEDAFMVAGPLALAICVVLLQSLNLTHPPACSTVLLAVYAPDSGIAWDGYFYMVLPVLTGLTILLMAAWLGNNVVPGRHYPSYW
jgi:CBS domain-containing membrane protein